MGKSSMAEDRRSIENLVNELSALRIRVVELESQLYQREQGATTVGTTTSTPSAPATIMPTKVDSVRITNKIKKPANWLARWDEQDIENKRTATVTDRVCDQVSIVTDNGTKTWRALNYLERIA